MAPGVPQSRATAIAFVALLVLSAVPAVIPTAEAQTSTVAIQSIDILWRNGASQYVPLPSGQLVKPGDSLRFSVVATAQDCPTGSVSTTPTVTAKINTTTNLTSSDTTGTLASSGGQYVKDDIGPITVVTSTPGLEGLATMGVVVTRSCTPVTSPTTPTLDLAHGSTPSFNADTRAPVIATPSFSHSDAASRRTGAPLVGVLPDLGVGSTITFSASAVDGLSIVNMTADPSALGVAASTSGGTATTATISGTAVIPTGTLDGTANFVLRATDAAGNVATFTKQYSVDNQPPPVLTGHRAHFTREAGLNYLKLEVTDWVPAKSTEVPFAEVLVNGASVQTVDYVAGASYNIPVSNALTSTPTIALRAVDNAGNVALGAGRTITPFLDITATYTASQANPTPIPAAGIASLPVTLPNLPSPWPANTTFDVTMMNVLTNKYWDIALDPSLESSYKTTLTDTMRARYDFENGTLNWNFALTNFSTATRFPGKSFIDGVYRLNYTLTNTATGDRTHLFGYIKVDSAAPVLTAPSLGLDAIAVHDGRNGNPFTMTVYFNETRTEDSGLRDVTIELVNTAQSAIAKTVNNADSRIFLDLALCAGSAPPTWCSTNVHQSGAQKAEGFRGAYTGTFPDLAPGDYRIRVFANDTSGNMRVKVFDGASEIFKVRPYIGILEKGDLPYLKPEGIEISALSGFRTAAPITGLACDTTDKLCSAANVTILARNLGTTEEKELVKMLLPRTEREEQLGLPGRWYNFSSATPLGVQGLNTSQIIEVKAISKVLVGGVEYVSDTGWVRVKSQGAPSLNINLPARSATEKDWYVNTTIGGAGRVPYNVTFDYLAGSAPHVRYWLEKLDGTSVTLNETGAFSALTVGGQAPSFRYNYTINRTTYNMTNFTGLTEGEYRLRVRAYPSEATYQSALTSGDLNKSILSIEDRYFAVVTTQPTISFVAEPRTGLIHDSTNGFQTLGSFDIGVVVNHGLANITDSSAFDWRLRRAQVLPGQSEFLANNTDGFTVSVKNHAPYRLDATATVINLTVTLPSNAKDGDRFSLNMTARTDAINSLGAQYANYTATGFALVQLDNANPVGQVSRLETNATGRDLANPNLAFIGVASDSGSGVKKVEVKLRNVTEGSTFVWNVTTNGTFVLGDRDSWMSSELLPAVGTTNQFVQFVSLNPSTGLWAISTDNHFLKDSNGADSIARSRILVDRYSEYELTVRVTDKVGQISTSAPTTVRFDPDPPQIVNGNETVPIMLRPGGFSKAPTEVAYHATPVGRQEPTHDFVFHALVGDNNCVKNVWLKAKAPSGTIRSAPFNGSVASTITTRPSENVCTTTTGNGIGNWSISLANHPHLVSEIGATTFWVEAEDFAGRSTMPPTAWRNLTLPVKDTLPAYIAGRHFEPPIAQVGGSTKLFMNVVENQGIDRVDVYAVKLLGAQDGARYGPFAASKSTTDPPAANGTGVWLIDTKTDMNLTLEAGEYRFEIRPIDVERTGCGEDPACGQAAQMHALLKVVSDAAPDVSRVLPAAGTPYVNATPEFRYSAVDPGLVASGIKVELGNSSANLSTITPTITGTNSTGFTIVFKPALGPEVENVTVRVSATDSSGFTTVVTDTFPVDAAPPEVSVEVTGNRTGPDGRDYAVAATRVNISATDAVSGVKSITYVESINNATGPTQTLSAGSSITPSGGDGFYRLTYTVTDNASNVKTGSLEFYRDTTGPAITLSGASNGLELTVSVVDKVGTVQGVGLNESTVRLHYAYTGETVFTNASFEKVTGNLFKVTLPRNASEEGMRYYVEAEDLFGNVGTLGTLASPRRITVDGGPDENETVDLAPTISITSPTGTTTVSTGSLAITYVAADAENETVVITVALRGPNGPTVLMTRGENTGEYVLDASALTPGDYTVVLTATAGAKDAQAEVSFKIADKTPTGPPVKVVTPPASNATAGNAVSFTVDLSGTNKDILRATYTVTKDGSPVGSGTLTRSATGYTGTFTPTSAGSYQVLVAAQFTDGTTMQPTSAAQFSVAEQEAPTPTGAGFPTSLILLLVLGVLTVGLAAYAAFVRWKQ